MIDIPKEYHAFIHTVFGEEGDRWLQALPALIADYADRWSLVDLGKPFGLSYNYVIPVTCGDGRQAVLKVNSPHGEHESEIDALLLYNGEGVSQLWEVDRERGVLLLERVLPGGMLSDLPDDEECTAIAATLLQSLWRPAPEIHHFPTVAGWFQGFAKHRIRFNGTGPLDANLFATAESIVQELLAADHAPVLLHGDFHHYNILQAERAPWLVIDPKGVVGDPGYELGAFLYNPSDRIDKETNAQSILQRRVDQLSEHLGFTRERVRNWGVAQAVLSAVWSCESEDSDGAYTMGIAKSLLTLAI